MQRSIFAIFSALLGTSSAFAADLSGVGQFFYTRPPGINEYYCVATLLDTNGKANAPAYVVSNAHCHKFFINPKEIKHNLPVDITMEFTAKKLMIRAEEMVYGSMNGTDLAVYRLDKTIGEIRAFGITPIKLADSRGTVGENILRAQSDSEAYNCPIDGAALTIKEERYLYLDAYRYMCTARHGSSGSPLISINRGVLIGIHNTGRPKNDTCSNNNPCEIDEHGNVRPHNVYANYGQRVDMLRGCFDSSGTWNLAAASCALPR